MRKKRSPASRATRSSAKKTAASGFSRIPSGIPGVDQILNGGFLKGGCYLILGDPGTGKTIFANQLSFYDHAAGRRALYVTLLAENHARMFGHLETLTFFDRSRVSEKIQYVSGYAALEKDGLDGLMKLLGALVHRYRSTILFIDGIASAEDLSGTSINFKKFVHNLNSVLGLSDCTTFLLSSGTGDAAAPEYTMVDGIIHLRFERKGMLIAREIEVAKFRGSPHLYGRHYFEIGEDGIRAYPRTETTIGQNVAPDLSRDELATTGQPDFDKLLGGGLVPGSITSLVGPNGTGKTTLASRFLEEGVRKGENPILVSFYEHPTLLKRKMDRLGGKFAQYLKAEKIHVLRRLPVDYLLDKLIYLLVDRIKEVGAQRLVIDGLGGLKDRTLLGIERMEDVLKSLAAELRHLGVTTLIIEESDRRNDEQKNLVSYNSSITDNIVEFRNVLMDNGRSVVVNVAKTREQAKDPGFYELELTSTGAKIGRQVKFVTPELPQAEYVEPATKNEGKGKKSSK